MHIVHVLIGRPKPRSSVGLVKSVYYLAVHQGELGNTIDILSIRAKTPLEPSSLGKGVVNYTYKMNKLRFFVDPEIVAFIKLHKETIDVVHFHSGYHPEYLVLAKLLTNIGIPYIISPRGSYQEYANRKGYLKKKAYKTLFERPFSKNACAIHALNKAEYNGIVAYGISAEKLFIVPNGIDFSTIPPRINLVDTPLKAISEADFVVVYCGRVDLVAKGLDLLVEAISEIANIRECPSVDLVIIGPDWKGGVASLESMIDRLQLRGRVHVLGPIFDDTKYTIYQGSDLFALTSRSEGMPTGVLEAMAFGMPCLLTPETNIDSEAAELDACIFVECNARKIAQAICDLTRSRKHLANLGENAIRFVRKNYEYEKVAENMLTKYIEYGQN